MKGWPWGLAALLCTVGFVRTRKDEPPTPEQIAARDKLKPMAIRPPFRFGRWIRCSLTRHEPIRYVLGGDVCAACGLALLPDYVNPERHQYGRDGHFMRRAK